MTEQDEPRPLDQTEQAEEPAPDAVAPEGTPESGSRETVFMPQVTFTTFILSLASSGLVQLGEVPDPQSGKTEQNLVMAKHTIDVLTMLRDKTSGCLEQDEITLLDALLYELRMKYVIKAE